MSVASKILTTSQTGYLPAPPRTPSARRVILFTAGVWLVFLGWTVLTLLESTAPVLVQAISWTALVAFPVVYLYGFLHPELFPEFSRHLNTLIFTVALIVLGVLMSLAAPTAIINVVPYLMALWIFNHRLFTGIIAVVVFFLAAVVVVVLGNHTDYPNWFLASVGSPAIIMVFVRVSIELGARQQERSERLVLAAQREELASTVHDVLGHSLTTITVKIQLAQRLLDTNLDAAKTELADIEALARRSLSEVRTTVTDLQHPDLAEQLDQTHKALTAAGVTFHRPDALPRLTLVQQQVFAWVIREAVTNVLRHAHATSCVISIVQEDASMVLRIEDDGVGITDVRPVPHHGLAGLQRRVTSAGGILELSRLNPGTRLEVRL